jgi:Rod binding domain-containing protein
MQSTNINPVTPTAASISSAAPPFKQALITVQGTPSNGPSPKLVAAAHEFEAQMMKELLKPLASSGAPGSTDSEDSENSGGALGAFATEAFGRALSNGGGFGIAKSILSSLSHTKTITPVTKQTHFDTQINLHK